MEKQIKNLEDFELINLKNLSSKKTELVYNIGELHLEISELKKLLVTLETQYNEVSNELNNLLVNLNEKYPNGEINLENGTVIF